MLSAPKTNTTKTSLKTIEAKIYLVRGKKVMFDSDLAELYEVETKTLNRSVKRNFKRFPEDFMFQLSDTEIDQLRDSIDPLTSSRGGRRYKPFVFTQEGIAMLSGVLKSDRAVEANIAIMRTFVKFRSFISNHQELSRRLIDLESKYDRQFKIIFDTIRELMSGHVVPNKRIIGLGREDKNRL